MLNFGGSISKNFPTDPERSMGPQTPWPNSLCFGIPATFGGERGCLGYAPGVCWVSLRILYNYQNTVYFPIRKKGREKNTFWGKLLGNLYIDNFLLFVDSKTEFWDSHLPCDFEDSGVLNSTSFSRKKITTSSLAPPISYPVPLLKKKTAEIFQTTRGLFRSRHKKGEISTSGDLRFSENMFMAGQPTPPNVHPPLEIRV